MIDFDPTPYARMREDVRDLVTVPVQAWMLTPPARRRDEMFVDLLTIPIDLAAADYCFTVTQTDRGWYLELKRKVAPRSTLHVSGQARSYVSALFQLADAAGPEIDRLEHKARRRMAGGTDESEAA